MTCDKQLPSVQLDQVIEKRRLERALNAKEFAVLAASLIPQHARGFVFQAFPLFAVWFLGRILRSGVTPRVVVETPIGTSPGNIGEIQIVPRSGKDLPARVAQLLAEAD